MQKSICGLDETSKCKHQQLSSFSSSSLQRTNSSAPPGCLTCYTVPPPTPPLSFIFLLSGMKQLCGNEASAHRTKTLPHSSFCFKYTFFFFLLQTLCGNSAFHERPLYVTESPSSCRLFPPSSTHSLSQFYSILVEVNMSRVGLSSSRLRCALMLTDRCFVAAASLGKRLVKEKVGDVQLQRLFASKREVELHSSSCSIQIFHNFFTQIRFIEAASKLLSTRF